MEAGGGPIALNGALGKLVTWEDLVENLALDNITTLWYVRYQLCDLRCRKLHSGFTVNKATFGQGRKIGCIRYTKRAAAGADLPTPRVFEPARRPDGRAGYSPSANSGYKVEFLQ